VAVAAFNVNPENWSPFMPFGWFGESAEGKPIGIFAGAALVFFAYVGFDAVSTAAEEARNPQRDLPIGIIASLLICTVIYIVVSGLLTGIVPYTDLNVSSPVAHSLQLLGFNWASGLVATGVIAGLTTVMLVLYYGLTRVIFSMSRDGLLPAVFATVNDKTQTPVRVITICGVMISVTAGFIPLGELAELVNIGTLFAFVMVCLGVIVLRVLHPDIPRPFKAPYGLLFPVLGVLSCSSLMLALPHTTWIRFLMWLILGLIFYFVFSMRNSKLAKSQGA
jgi:APA family basic amino acid/polyamine antiporter